MTTQLHRIAVKPTDYKICQKCKKLNWYENEECCECSESDFNSYLVLGYIENEYRFYEEEEGYSESEIDDIEVEC